MVKTSAFNAGDTGSILGQKAKILCAVQPKKINQNIKKGSNTVTNSIKTLKMIHIRKNIFKIK